MDKMDEFIFYKVNSIDNPSLNNDLHLGFDVDNNSFFNYSCDKDILSRLNQLELNSNGNTRNYDFIFWKYPDGYENAVNEIFKVFGNSYELSSIEEILLTRHLLNEKSSKFILLYFQAITNFVNGQYKSYNSDIKKLIKLSETNNADILKVYFKSLLLQVVSRNFKKDVSILFSNSESSPVDKIQKSVFQRSISIFNRFSSMKTRFIVTNQFLKEEIEKIIIVNITKILIIIGHGNDKHGCKIIFKNGENFEDHFYLTIDYLADKFKKLTSADINQLFIIFCCDSVYFCKYNGTRNAQIGFTLGSISFEHAELFVFNFFKALELDDDVKKCYEIAKFVLSAKSRDYYLLRLIKN
jgi:hypothetical protein